MITKSQPTITAKFWSGLVEYTKYHMGTEQALTIKS